MLCIYRSKNPTLYLSLLLYLIEIIVDHHIYYIH